jgi:hypothetical protein
MSETKQDEIKDVIHNPITKSMKPGQEALTSAIAQSGPTKIDPNQISTGLDKRENKIAHKRSPKD